MSSRIFAAFGIGAFVLVSACAQQEEPTTVYPDPVYNKMGEMVVGSCRPAGQSVSTMYPDYLPECDPPSDCQDTYVVGAQVIPCPPPYREPDGGNDGGRQQDPTGAQN